MIFEIPAENFPSLKKRLEKIQKKCEKYNCVFKFEKKSEIYKKVKINDNFFNVKFIVIEAEGIAKEGNWEIVGLIEHTENGNIIKEFSNEIKIPSKFKEASPVCEHCHKIRQRNSTFILYNTEKKEFKQVGKSCLQDYTGVLSVNHAVALESFFKKIVELSDVNDYFTEGGYSIYDDLDMVILYSIETVKKFGYHKKSETDVVTGNIPTSIEVENFLSLFVYHSSMYEAYRDEIQKKADKCGFYPESEENKELLGKIKEWISTCEDDSNYIHNLKVLFSSQYVDRKYLSLVVSSIPAYKRTHAEKTNSEFVGKVNEKVTFNVKSLECVYTFEAFKDLVKIYKIIDDKGNVFIWKTNISVTGTPKCITGTVKNHEEYRGVKQTVLKRCKLIG